MTLTNPELETALLDAQFALKAAEKVDNLSQELDRLTAYLQQELTDAAGGAPQAATPEALRLKDARIESAIHIIGTLKSVNDRSLSDWQGVIGDELDTRQRRLALACRQFHVSWVSRSTASALELSAQGGLGPLQPLAVVFAGVAWPVPGVVHDLGIQLARSPLIGLVGQQLFFEAADGQDFAAQRDFAGHGNVTTDGDFGEGAGEVGVGVAARIDRRAAVAEVVEVGVPGKQAIEFADHHVLPDKAR